VARTTISEVRDKHRRANGQEADNISYEFHQSTDDATEFATYEEWVNATALDAHIHSPHMATFFGKVGPLSADQEVPEVRELRVQQKSL